MSVLNAVRIFARENNTAILTGFAITGVVATSIFTAKASIKAEDILRNTQTPPPTKKEEVKKLLPIFMPAIVSGVLTIGCIYASHSLDSNKQMALMSAYSLSERAMKTMEDKLGEKKVKQVKQAIFEDDVKKNPPKEMYDTGKGTTKFRDGIFGGDFISDIEYVKSVFNKYNKYLNDGDIVLVNDLRWDLGLPTTEMGSVLGWDCGQLDEHLDSYVMEKDLQDVKDEDLDNIFVISYNRPTILHHGY